MTLVQEDKTRCFACGKEFPQYSKTNPKLRSGWYELVRYPFEGRSMSPENRVLICMGAHGRPIVGCERKALEKLRDLGVCPGCGGGHHHPRGSEEYSRHIRIDGLCSVCRSLLPEAEKLRKEYEELTREIFAQFFKMLSGDSDHAPNIFEPDRIVHGGKEWQAARELYLDFRIFISRVANTNYEKGLQDGSKMLQRLADGTLDTRSFELRTRPKPKRPKETVESILEELARDAKADVAEHMPSLIDLGKKP